MCVCVVVVSCPVSLVKHFIDPKYENLMKSHLSQKSLRLRQASQYMILS